MPSRYFCTLFDRNYLLKGVVMLRSITRHCPGARVFVLAMDDVTAGILNQLAIPGVVTIPVAAVEDEEVLAAKSGRSIAEYCWTLGSVLLWHVVEHYPEIELVTYLDADLMFFSPVEPLFDEMGAGSISIIEHRYTPRLAHLKAYGRFNVQWVAFRRDADGLDCLRSWRAQCLEWCFARVEKGKLGDQTYLDAWPGKYKALRILDHKGAGVAPWYYPNYRVTTRADDILVDGVPLVFYHFHQFQILEGGKFDYISSVYSQDVAPPEAIYGRYCDAITSTLAEVRKIDPQFNYGLRAASSVTLRRIAQRLLPLGMKNVLRRIGIQAW